MLKIKKHLLTLLVVLTALSALASQDESSPKKYQLKLEFTGPTYKWHRTVEFREDFHFFMDDAPIQGAITGFIAGVIYEKKGAGYISLTIGKTIDKGDRDADIGGVKYFKFQENKTFDVPMTSGDFKTCKATLVPIK